MRSERIIFVSHSSVDRSLVETFISSIEGGELACWASFRDIDAMKEYSTQIEQSIDAATAFAVLISRSANASSEVLKEVELALKYKKLMFVVMLEPGVKPEGGLAYHLSTQNWLNWHHNTHATTQAILKDVMGWGRLEAKRHKPHLALSIALTFEDENPLHARFADQRVGAPPLPVGSRIGEYELVEVVHASNFAISYRATGGIDGGSYYIKELCPVGVASRRDEKGRLVWPRLMRVLDKGRVEAEKRFQTEGRILETLNSRHVPALVSQIKENRTRYIVTEWIFGKSLADYIDVHGALNWSEAYGLFRASLSCLRDCHFRGIVHCDIKPSNMMISSGRPPVLVDFGSALQLTPSLKSEEKIKVRSVSAGFSPPELVADASRMLPSKDIGPWLDLFSLSASIFYSIVGRRPRVGALSEECAMLISEHGLPPAFGASLCWCLSANPDKRPREVSVVENLLDVASG